jgi:S-adenosylmethionine:tRNA-ribosyltransferase-isomerase (queuine synthetase)
MSATSTSISPELIAQEPPAERGTARMLCVDRRTGALTHTTIAHLTRFCEMAMCLL